MGFWAALKSGYHEGMTSEADVEYQEREAARRAADQERLRAFLTRQASKGSTSALKIAARRGI